ncbi:MAG TPA: diguanylate cyclase [Pyrinomonadaceae bacterium]|nr:diguanylate cyclase [Pyrinomonadaceae bacterium]
MLDDLEDKSLTILVADDEPINRTLIQRRLERAGYHILAAENGREAVEAALSELPDLIILDVMMPLMDGLEACRLIKENEATRSIPIIFLSARDETDVKVSGLNLGANDYISKPFKAEELLARVEVAIRMKRERDHLRLSAEEARAHAEVAQERAMTDALTGLLNRYGLQRVLAHEYAEARRYTRPLSCLMIDLDNFKTINDTYGHMAGDTALKQVAGILTQVVRRSDLLSRYGGDEFLALLPETDLEGADALAEKVRLAAASQIFGDGEPSFQLTLSIGAATLFDDESGNDMIVRADMALYDAKEQGRNRVGRAGTQRSDDA